jgi:hypothetical protein
MSKERELLKKVIRNMQYINYSCNKNIRDEITELLAQPAPITFKDDADKIAHLENSIELLSGLLDSQKREPIDTRRITLEMFSDGVDINYKNGYVAGINFAEKAHGIGGGE